MKKITKTDIKRLIKKEGSVRVGLLPSKISPEGIWMSPTWLTISSEAELEKWTNEYSYYNCNAETGKRVSYYLNEAGLGVKRRCEACKGTGIYQDEDCPFCNGIGVR